MYTRTFRFFVAAAAVAFLAACTTPPEEAAPVTLAPRDDTTTTTAPQGSDPGPPPDTVVPVVPVDAGAPVTNRGGVIHATVRIVTDGNFVAPYGPDVGELDLPPGVGSGFAIYSGFDPDVDYPEDFEHVTFVVTGNHVVVGAETVEVWPANATEPREASVVGYDDCAGLAVLAVEGDPLPYLEWYDEDRVREGLQVFAAGFGERSESYALTAGQIRFEETMSSSIWSAPELVVGHTAESRPGIAGGPLVDANGKVVGIATPPGSVRGAASSTAMFAGAVIGVVDALTDGSSRGLGVNGVAVVTDAGFGGVWVSAVHEGSLAEQTGLLPGDIIGALDGIAAVNWRLGSMAGWCTDLEHHIAAGGLEGLPIEVLRYETGDVYVGAVGTPVALTEPGVHQLPGAPVVWRGDDVGSGPVVDEFEHVTVDVPVTWSDRRTAPIAVDQIPSSFVLATPDVEAFEALDRSTPGVRATVSRAWSPERVSLDELAALVFERNRVAEDCFVWTPDAVDDTGEPVPEPTPIVLADYAAYLDVDASWTDTSGFVHTFTECGEPETTLTIVVGQLEDVDAGEGAGFVLELQTTHQVLEREIPAFMERIDIVGWP